MHRQLLTTYPHGKAIARHLRVTRIGDKVRVTANYRNSRTMFRLAGTKRPLQDGELVAEGEAVGDNLSDTLLSGFLYAFSSIAGEVEDGSSIFLFDRDMCYITAAIASLWGPKYRRVIAHRNRYLIPRIASVYFQQVTQSMSIQSLVADQLRILGLERYSAYATNGFVTTTPTPLSMQRIMQKMCQSQMTWPVSDDQYLLSYLLLIRDVVRPLSGIDLSDLALNRVPRRASSSAGFRDNYYRVDKGTGVGGFSRKGDKWPLTVNRLKWALSRIASGEDPWSTFLEWGHVLMAKPEVRGPDDDPSKIRLIATSSCEAEMVSDLISRHLMESVKSAPWCSVGHSQFDNATYGLLLGLKHPLASKYRIAKPSECVDGPCFYIEADITSLDYSMVPRPFMMLSALRALYFDWEKGDPMTANLFEKMFSVEMGWNNVKLLETFGEHWYTVYGIMLSGYKCTSVFGTMMVRWAVIISFMNLLGEQFPVLFPLVGNVIYGDDLTLRLPLRLLPYVSTDGTTPDKLAAEFARLSMAFKASQTHLYLPSPGAPDRLFTSVYEGTVVHPGIRYLQRYYVKVDVNGTILPPNQPFHAIATFRPTEDYVLKLAHHPYGWKVTTKEGHNLDPRVLLYQKAFSLALECSANRDALDLCLNVMRELEKGDFNLADVAFLSYDPTESYKKLGEFDVNLFKSLSKMEDPYVYLLSLTHLTTKGLRKFHPVRACAPYSRMFRTY